MLKALEIDMFYNWVTRLSSFLIARDCLSGFIRHMYTVLLLAEYPLLGRRMLSECLPLQNASEMCLTYEWKEKTMKIFVFPAGRTIWNCHIKNQFDCCVNVWCCSETAILKPYILGGTICWGLAPVCLSHDGDKSPLHSPECNFGHRKC